MPQPLASSFTYNATTVTFDIAVEGRDVTDEADISVRHIPGSDIDYVDNGGRKSPTRQYTLLLPDGATYNDLRPLVGKVGTLVCYEGTFTALLRKATSGKWYPSTAQQVRADFLITGEA